MEVWKIVIIATLAFFLAVGIILFFERKFPLIYLRLARTFFAVERFLSVVGRGLAVFKSITISFTLIVLDWIHLFLLFACSVGLAIVTIFFLIEWQQIDRGSYYPPSPVPILADYEWQLLLGSPIPTVIILALFFLVFSMFIISLKCTIQMFFNPYETLKRHIGS